MRPLKYSAFGMTDIGSFYSKNEDNFFYKIVNTGGVPAGICAVADGVGGEAQGDVASAKAVSAVNEWFHTEFRENYGCPSRVQSTLTDCFSSVNRELLDLAVGKVKRIATTLSVFLFVGNRYFVAHTGDSRIYQCRGLFSHPMKQITADQSGWMKTYINGEPVMKSVLAECLGNKEVCNVFTQTGRIRKNDLFLLCSDGLYKKTACRQVQNILKKRSGLKESCELLIDYAKRCGEKDNLTVVLLTAGR